MAFLIRFMNTSNKYFRSPAAPWAGVVLAMLVLLANASTYFLIMDDAYISFRFAENLSRGAGLVFNIGERVEGYTNFLWILILSAFHKLGASTPLTAQILGTLAAVLVIPIVYVAGVRIIGLGRFLALGPCFAVAASASIAMWSGSGLETTCYMTLFTLALTVMLVDLEKDRILPVSGLLFGLAYLTRPEGAGMFAVACALALLLRLGRFRTLLKITAGFAVVFVPHMVFRLIYYGYPLPNTFYAKTAASGVLVQRGLEYTAGFAMSHGVWTLPLLALLPWLAFQRGRRSVLIPLGVLLFATLYIISVGGDFYEYYRFFVPYLPWFVLLVCGGAWYLGQFLSERFTLRRRLIPHVLLIIAALALGAQAKLSTDARYLDHMEPLRLDMKRVEQAARWLRGNFPPDALVAGAAMGIFPYTSGLPTIDMLGVVDEHIAHRHMPIGPNTQAGHFKQDPEYVLSRKPDIVIVELPFPKGFFKDESEVYTQHIYKYLLSNARGIAAEIGLMNEKAFRLHYVPHVTEVADFSFVYFRRDDTLLHMRDRTTASDPNPADHFKLALRYRKQGLYDEAVASLRRAAALDPGKLQIERNIGFFLIEADRFDEAYKEFQALRQAHPDDRYSVYGAALSLQHMGMYKYSAALWEEFLKMSPESDPFVLKARSFLEEAKSALSH
jgi:arabinofuranosyltransferase